LGSPVAKKDRSRLCRIRFAADQSPIAQPQRRERSLLQRVNPKLTLQGGHWQKVREKLRGNGHAALGEGTPDRNDENGRPRF